MARNYSNQALVEAASQGFDLGVEGVRKRRREEEEREFQRQAAEQKAAADLQRVLAGEGFKAQLKREAEEREGEAALEGINEYLSRDLPMARSLGRVDVAPPPVTEDEAAAFAGGRPNIETYVPFKAKPGRGGAKALSELLKAEITSRGAAERTAMAQEAAAARLAALIRSREGIAERRETAADRRQDALLHNQVKIQQMREAFDRWKTQVTEAGKTVRGKEMAGAIAVAGKAPAASNALREAMAELNQARAVVAAYESDTSGDPMIPSLLSAARAQVRDLESLVANMQNFFEASTQRATPRALGEPTKPSNKDPLGIR